jgi:glycosyltransferase involved in cell wall biosynthesis
MHKLQNGVRCHVMFLINSAGVGGAETHTISLVNGLDRRRFRVSLVYLRDETDLLNTIDRRQPTEFVFCGGVKKKFDRAAIAKLVRFVREESVDIAVCANVFPLFYAWATRFFAWRALRIVEVLHSTGPLGLRSNFSVHFFRTLLRMSDALVYVCHSQRQHWSEHYFRSRIVEVIHNGVDIEHFSNTFQPGEILDFRKQCGFSSEDYVVGLCAYMRPEKAHCDLVKAVALARHNGLNVKCILIGDGPERQNIEEVIRDLEMEAYISITGVVEDVRLSICACDVMVIPSHIETFSVAALESMALRRPMIMTDVGGASEQIDDPEGGYLYPKGNIERLAHRLFLLSDSARRLKMADRASAIVSEKFSSKKMISAYETLLWRLQFNAKTEATVATTDNVARS